MPTPLYRTDLVLETLNEAAVSPARTCASVWVAIFETGFRLQQYFGPLYDLEMADINPNWESDVVNHQPTSENQSLCIYGDSTGFSYKRSFDVNGIRIIDDKALLADCRNPASVLFLGDSFMEGHDDSNTLPYHVASYLKTEHGVCLKTCNSASNRIPRISIGGAAICIIVSRERYLPSVDASGFVEHTHVCRLRELNVGGRREGTTVEGAVSSTLISVSEAPGSGLPANSATAALPNIPNMQIQICRSSHGISSRSISGPPYSNLILLDPAGRLLGILEPVRTRGKSRTRPLPRDLW